MNDSHAAQSGLPNVMLDALTIGLCGEVVSKVPISPADLRDRFAKMEPWVKVTTPKSKKTHLDYMQVTLFLESESGPSLGTATLDLFFSKHDRGLRVTQRSSLSLNPQRWIRALLGGETACGPIGLDGNNNVLGARRDLPRLLGQAIALVQEVFEHAIEVFDRSVPEGADWWWQRVWLKSAEACRDILVGDAVAAVRRAQHAAIVGSVGTVRRGYEPRAREGKRVTALSWLCGKSRPEYKVYAKRKDLLRLEFVCRDRGAVVWFAGKSTDATDLARVRRFLAKFAIAAAAEVDRLESHVRETLAGTPDLPGLLVALAPLSAMAAGIKTGRGPAPEEVSRRAANDALGGIMTVGQYDASHLSSGLAIRAVLKALGGEGGPLLKQMKRSVYSLDPAFAASAETVMEMAAARSSGKEDGGG
jgi:hypothetical protein